MKLIDKTNGYIFSGIEASAVEFSKIAVGPLDWDYYRYPCLLLILNIIFAQFYPIYIYIYIYQKKKSFSQKIIIISYLLLKIGFYTNVTGQNLITCVMTYFQSIFLQSFKLCYLIINHFAAWLVSRFNS